MEEYCIVDWSALSLCIWKSLTISPLSENFLWFWQSKMWFNDDLDDRREDGAFDISFLKIAFPVLFLNNMRIVSWLLPMPEIVFSSLSKLDHMLHWNTIVSSCLYYAASLPTLRNLCASPVDSLFVKSFSTCMCHERIQADWLEKVSFSGHYMIEYYLENDVTFAGNIFWHWTVWENCIKKKNNLRTLIHIPQSLFLNLIENEIRHVD